MFGFSSDSDREEEKGYFPHGYTSEEQLEAAEEPCLPDKWHFFPGRLYAKERAEFEKWYEENKDKPFHFKSLALKYGRQDVRILAKACLAFRAEIMAVADVDPWISSFTLAGICSKIFRADMLEEDTIGLVPANGYNKGSKVQSLTAFKYLHWIAETRGLNIRTAFSVGGEVMIPGIGRVDGYCADTGEFFNHRKKVKMVQAVVSR